MASYLDFQHIGVASEDYRSLPTVTGANGATIHLKGSIEFRLTGTATTSGGHKVQNCVLNLGSGDQLSRFAYRGSGTLDCHFYQSDSATPMSLTFHYVDQRDPALLDLINEVRLLRMAMVMNGTAAELSSLDEAQLLHI